MMGVVIVIVVYYQKYKENRLRRKLLSERKGFTRLMDFCAQGDLTNVKAELSKGANLDQQDEGGATALIYAVMNNKDEVIRFLVESGVDIHLRTKTGLTALQIAQNNKYHNVVAMLTNVSTK
jgi:ankyrin repeat protein